jgi:predicted TIM-barrel fold metal-dependent hydrolase
MIRGSPIRPSVSQNRKSLLVLFSCLAVSFLFYGCLIRQVGGAFSKEPEDLQKSASAGAKKLIDQALEGIQPQPLVDHHVHIVALGSGGSGAFVNPKMRSRLHWIERLKFSVYASAAGIKSLDNADQEYVSRLVRLIRAIPAPGKYRLLAFDKHYNSDGSVNLGKTNFYVPNEYIFRLVHDYPDLFLPVISVHPYRPAALEELEKWAQKGAKYVKWLPNAMGIDPSNPRLDRFYKKMKDYRMILLSHAGEEQAVEAEEDQRLGNPLLLRKPLDYGLRVIMAHGASLGSCIDLDSPAKVEVSCFDLFLRLMDEKKYDGLLFGEISAVVQFNRMPGPITAILQRQDLHHRLVNGSDYPLPAINFLIRTGQMARDGFITEEERGYLNEIYDYNPLLFDFVLKRTMRHPHTGQKLAPSVFMANPGLEN